MNGSSLVLSLQTGEQMQKETARRRRGCIEGTDLIVRRMSDNKEKTFKLVSEYYFDKKGTKLLIETTRNSKDSNSRAMVLIYNLSSEKKPIP